MKKIENFSFDRVKYDRERDFIKMEMMKRVKHAKQYRTVLWDHDLSYSHLWKVNEFSRVCLISLFSLSSLLSLPRRRRSNANLHAACYVNIKALKRLVKRKKVERKEKALQQHSLFLLFLCCVLHVLFHEQGSKRSSHSCWEFSLVALVHTQVANAWVSHLLFRHRQWLWRKKEKKSWWITIIYWAFFCSLTPLTHKMSWLKPSRGGSPCEFVTN